MLSLRERGCVHPKHGDKLFLPFRVQQLLAFIHEIDLHDVNAFVHLPAGACCSRACR